MEFNLSGLCSRTCSFCPRTDPTKFPNLNKHLPIEVYEKVMVDLAKVEFKGNILYSAFSEPTMYRHLEDVLKLSKHYCPESRIELVTNGDLLNLKKVKRYFDAGLTQMGVSLYDGPHQVPKFEKLRLEAGLTKEQFNLRIRWLPPEENFGITLSNRAGAQIMEEIGLKKLDTSLKRKCFYPFYQTLIDFDGAVLLCSHDWDKRLILGNVKEESILDIWTGDTIKEVRAKLAVGDRNQTPCNRCDAHGMLMGGEFVDKWKKYYDKQAISK
ncbi:MAG: SPASM domain-containing protein [Nanoarchaeota archaeon]|nr:SPASM domain-containing protein [Nanoarchaeota archaeon]